MNPIRDNKEFKKLKSEIAEWAGPIPGLASLTGEDAIIRYIITVSHKKQLKTQDEAEVLMDKVEECYKKNNHPDNHP